MQLQQKLLQNKRPTPNPSSQYFIDRYNLVIDTYNKSLTNVSINVNSNTGTNVSVSASRQQNENEQYYTASLMKLQYLDNNQLFKKFNWLLRNNCVKVCIVVLLGFVPVANLVVYGGLWFYFLFLKREGNKHKNNLKKTKNPLQNYYFLPQICHQLSKHCTTIQISPKQLQGFTFNDNLHSQLKQNQRSSMQRSSMQRSSMLTSAQQSGQISTTAEIDGKTVDDIITVTIYDQYFYDSFHLFKKEQYKVGAWIVLATLLIAADVVFYGALFDVL